MSTPKTKIMDYLRDVDRSRNPLQPYDVERVKELLDQIVECGEECEVNKNYRIDNFETHTTDGDLIK